MCFMCEELCLCGRVLPEFSRGKGGATSLGLFKRAGVGGYLICSPQCSAGTLSAGRALWKVSLFV